MRVLQARLRSESSMELEDRKRQIASGARARRKLSTLALYLEQAEIADSVWSRTSSS